MYRSLVCSLKESDNNQSKLYTNSNNSYSSSLTVNPHARSLHDPTYIISKSYRSPSPSFTTAKSHNLSPAINQNPQNPPQSLKSSIIINQSASNSVLGYTLRKSLITYPDEAFVNKQNIIGEGVSAIRGDSLRNTIREKSKTMMSKDMQIQMRCAPSIVGRDGASGNDLKEFIKRLEIAELDIIKMKAPLRSVEVFQQKIGGLENNVTSLQQLCVKHQNKLIQQQAMLEQQIIGLVQLKQQHQHSYNFKNQHQVQQDLLINTQKHFRQLQTKLVNSDSNSKQLIMKMQKMQKMVQQVNGMVQRMEWKFKQYYPSIKECGIGGMNAPFRNSTNNGCCDLSGERVKDDEGMVERMQNVQESVHKLIDMVQKGYGKAKFRRTHQVCQNAIKFLSTERITKISSQLLPLEISFSDLNSVPFSPLKGTMQTPTTDTITDTITTYYIDPDGNLLDQNHCYIVDERGNLIRLTDSNLRVLTSTGLLRL